MIENVTVERDELIVMDGNELYFVKALLANDLAFYDDDDTLLFFLLLGSDTTDESDMSPCSNLDSAYSTEWMDDADSDSKFVSCSGVLDG
jgi:hypothetical protein